MTHFDEIYEIAADNYGIVTYGQAKIANITDVELRRYVKSGRLNRIGHGVYKLVKHTPTPYDHYAEATAHVGSGSYLFGETVLAMHNLALVNPLKTTVATNKRVRKQLPGWIQVVYPPTQGEVVFYEGIPSQNVADALRYCRDRIMKDRLAAAIIDAVYEGLIDEILAKDLAKELNCGTLTQT